FFGDRLEQLFLALEVDVERALRDAGLAGDVAHAGGVEPLRQEHRARALDDLAALEGVGRDRGRAERNGQNVCHRVTLTSLPYPCETLAKIGENRGQQLVTEPFGQLDIRRGR